MALWIEALSVVLSMVDFLAPKPLLLKPYTCCSEDCWPDGAFSCICLMAGCDWRLSYSDLLLDLMLPLFEVKLALASLDESMYFLL